MAAICFPQIKTAQSNLADLTRITVNQFRNHPNLDANVDGFPDTNANQPVGLPTSGTVLLTGAHTYGGTTEVLGGTLEIGGANGRIAGSSLVTVSNATLKLSSMASDRLKDTAGLTLSGTAALVLAGEYALLGDPLQSPPGSLIAPGQNAGAMTLVFQRDTARNDVTIRVQSSADLKTPWADEAVSINGAAFTSTTGATVGENGASTVKSVNFTIPIGSAPLRFFRVKAE